MEKDQAGHLKELVRDGFIRHLSIDTSTFLQNGLSLKGGLIGQLAQFRESRFKLILSSVVVDEIKRKISESHQDGMDSWKKTLKKLTKIPEVAPNARELDFLISEARTPSELAWHEINDFLLTTAADVISADHATIDEVLHLYFNGRPPFGPTKRKEFPDAIALLGIEAWTRASRGGTIIVSADGDWMRFCEERANENLFIVEDLKTALAIINESEEVRKVEAQTRFERVRQTIQSDNFHKSTAQLLRRHLSNESRAHGMSILAYTAKINEIELGNFEFGNGSRIRDDDAAISILFDVTAHATFWSTFYFFNENFTKPLGQGTYYIGKDISGGLLLTDDKGSVSTEILLNEENLSIDFGMVEPSGDGIASRHRT
ncbi:PIN domain-containing protein [Caballeronia sordidicola]|uniref:PIN domain-containing protein n=1 Tax=Caballeronia sordidicola TaxID=196367 RepID=UPI0004D02591|nr:PIN domain-containing protein [Caballeronia sordidicola]